MRVTSGDYLTVELMGFVLGGIEEVRRLLLERFDVAVELGKVDMGGGVGTVPFPALINALERNLDRLAATGFDGGMMAETVTWYGELFDRRRLDYTDVNRWIESIELMKRIIEAYMARWVVTGGGAAAGGDRERQLLRAV